MPEITPTELLAPARDLEAAIAAVDHGADAVYMGASKFGARHAAGNAAEDIARAVEYARKYGVRVYAALNTVLFDDELDEARRLAAQVIEAGVSALIIQDMAYLEMGLEGVEFHASTQVFNATPEKVKFLEQAGFSRVILERNLSLEQIREIRRASGVELEAFVHGAICVCHSGRCYMSRAAGTRSGNRGECSQPCRLSYDLSDGRGRELIKGRHLLSVRDLDLSARLGELLDAGITSFKIEGRLKDSNYVKNTVSHYRWRLDEAMASRKGHGRASHGRSIPDFVSDPSKSFMRGGGSEYFIDGRRKGVATLETPKAVGENMGTVAAAGKGWFGVEGTSKGEFTAGDGLCWMEGGELSGANVERVDAGRIFLNKPAVAPCGTALYRNHDHRFVAALTASRTRRVIGVEAHLRISAGRMELTVTDETGIEARSFHTGTFPRATDPDRALETMRAQISKSGETIFSVDSVAIKQEGEAPFVPVSILNALRREALNKLSKKRMTATLPRFAAEADPSARWPGGSVDATENVTNYLARRFYERHGARNVEDGLDLRGDLTGCTVMRTPYCVRREADLCGHDGNADLYLRRGALNYRLRFDCRDCIMEVIKI